MLTPVLPLYVIRPGTVANSSPRPGCVRLASSTFGPTGSSIVAAGAGAAARQQPSHEQPNASATAE